MIVGTCSRAEQRDRGGQFPRLVAAALVSAAVGLAGCGSSGSSSTANASGSSAASTSAGGSASTSGGGILVAESSPIASNYNVHAVTVGGTKAATQLGWHYKMLDANLSSSAQVSDIDTFVSLKVKGIITLTLDPGAADAAYARARQAGIPLVGINSTSKYIQTEIAEQTDTTCVPGQQAAAYIAQRIPHAKVLVVGGPPVPSVQLRSNCFKAAAKQAGLDVEETQYNVNDAESSAEPIVQSMLATHSDAQAIFAYNDPTALAASSIVNSSGKPIWSGNKKGIIIIGINGIPAAISAIKAGALTGTFDANSAQAGALAISALALVIKDHKPISSMPKKITVPTKLWDSSNINSYVAPDSRSVTVSTLK